MHFSRRLFIASAAVAIASARFGLDADARAQTAAEDGKRKINLAGRQRMLTQRMAKAACLAHLGIDPAAHMAMLTDARALYEKTLRGLKNGDADQGLLFESNRKVQNALGKADVAFRPYATVLARAEATGAVNAQMLAEIAVLNMPALVEMNKAVTVTERAYGGGDIPLHLAVAINIAGRQRMFTQKMTKELCLMSAGIEPEKSRAAMAETVNLFDVSLGALRNGMDMVGIRPPKGEALIAQLAVVEELWRKIRPLFAEAADGGALDDAQLALIAVQADAVLKEMNKAVFMYEDEI